MSMNGDIVRSVLDKAVKYDMPPSDTASLINDIFVARKEFDAYFISSAVSMFVITMGVSMR